MGGWSHKDQLQQHESQKDYSAGFGGKYGVQNDRVDKSAKGWSETQKTELHSSQTDSSKGFGGKFGVERDRVDSSAHSWEEGKEPTKTAQEKDQNSSEDGKCKEGAKNLKARFEQMAASQEEDARKAGEAEKERRKKR